jgi:photosystem II stability/assembly factor-like uncharacterized protein
LPVFEDDLHGYEAVSYSGPKGTASAAVLFETKDGGRTWKPDRILSNLAEGEVVATTVVDSTWVLPVAQQGVQPTLVRLHPNQRKTAPAHKGSGDFRRCRPSFVTPDQGWLTCSGALSSTADGGATWTTITPRTRNGVLTEDPATPENRTPVQTKAIPLPGSANAKPMLASPADGGIQGGISQHLAGFNARSFHV